jgi:hypothetical protein
MFYNYHRQTTPRNSATTTKDKSRRGYVSKYEENSRKNREAD